LQIASLMRLKNFYFDFLLFYIVEFSGYFAAIVISSVILHLVFEALGMALVQNLQNVKKIEGPKYKRILGS
jgi:hypothetical protein